MKKGGLFLILFSVLCSSLFSQDANLKLSGNGEDAYVVEILFGDRQVATNHVNGELNLIIQNDDRSVCDTIRNWKASKAVENDHGIKLSGQCYLENLMTYIRIEVNYSIINANVIKKEISLEQNNIPLLFYQLELSLSPYDRNAAFWSFDHLDHQGGAIREIYPAAGFLLDDSIALGLLTDAGYRNQWTRNIRKRPSDQRTNHSGFKAVQTIADVNLYQIADAEDRLQNDNFVRITFGELSDYNNGRTFLLKNKFLHHAAPYKGGEIKKVRKKDFIVKTDSDQPGANSGIKIPFTGKDGFYTFKFSYKSDQPFNLRLYKTRNSIDEVVGFHYKTGIPASGCDWHTFNESALLQGLEGRSAQLLIESKADIRIKDFEIIETDPKRSPYHRMPVGEKQSKTVFFFVQRANDLRAIRLASQTRLAEGLGFNGSDVEKVLLADFMMLTWISSSEDFSPHNVPSINYAPDMYNRDSFWSVVSVHDKKLNEAIWEKWGGTQDKRGAIGTILTPNMGSIENKGNEATCEWIWWGLINQRRFNSSLDTIRLKKALEFCIQEFDPEHDGIVSSQFSLSQNDVVYYEQKKSTLSVNQGVYAVTLMAAKELGLEVDQDYIDKAVREYRSFYDEEKGYLLSDRDFPYVISFTDLMPEFVSWWLWDRPLLDSEMVLNTLDKFPVINDCSPLICHVTDTFFTETNKPFLPEQMWPNGQYYNGGSWMRNEICAYVAGKKHGWEPAIDRIQKRMQAEIDLNYDEPFSHEIIPTDLDQPNCWWPSARVFSWNVFSLISIDIAGMQGKYK